MLCIFLIDSCGLYLIPLGTYRIFRDSQVIVVLLKPSINSKGWVMLLLWGILTLISTIFQVCCGIQFNLNWWRKAEKTLTCHT